MKFLQLKYLAFYPTLLIILYTIVKDVQNWHVPAYPMFVFTAPIVVVYLIIAISYYFLKSRKGQHKYIIIASNVGIFTLIIYTISMLLFYKEQCILNSFVILYLVFAYQFLAVIYTIITGIVIALKKAK